MKKFIIVILFFTGIASAQNFKSKVFFMNPSFVKFNTTIQISDSTVVITSENTNPTTYIIDNKIDYNYQLDYFGNKANLSISNTKGRSKGFSYNYIINFAFVDSSISPPILYYAIKED